MPGGGGEGGDALNTLECERKLRMFLWEKGLMNKNIQLFSDV